MYNRKGELPLGQVFREAFIRFVLSPKSRLTHRLHRVID